MDTTSKVIQFKAGFFVLLGLISIGSLVLYFGRFGESIQKYYPLTVDYRNASGLLKGADVLLAGAKIGEVSDAPTVLPGMRGVAVKLKIADTVEIPEGSVFSIGSSGLLGDRFVTVTMGDNPIDQKPIAPGSTITNGLSESSIAELQRQIHDEILPKLNSALDNINDVTGKLKNDVFNDQGVKNLQVTLANFKTASDALAASSGDIKDVTAKANLVLSKGNDAMSSVNVFVKKGNVAMDSVNDAAGDMKAFLANLRQHGILFYRDTAPDPTIGPLRKKH